MGADLEKDQSERYVGCGCGCVRYGKVEGSRRVRAQDTPARVPEGSSGGKALGLWTGVPHQGMPNS